MLYRINKDKGYESLSLSAFPRDVASAIFLKYSKEGRSSSSHVGILNVPSDVCYDDIKHYRCHGENKAGVSHTKRTPNTAA